MIIKFVMKFLPTCLPSGLTVAAPDAFGRIPGVGQCVGQKCRQTINCRVDANLGKLACRYSTCTPVEIVSINDKCFTSQWCKITIPTEFTYICASYVPVLHVWAVQTTHRTIQK